MSKALSVDLRDRVIAAIEDGMSCRQAATRFGVSASSAIRWRSRVRTQGDVRPGPLGGDQQVGAMIADGGLDILLFFTDALSPHPHDADVQALTRLSTLYNVALATNRTTADFLITSPFFGKSFQPTGGGDGTPAHPDARG